MKFTKNEKKVLRLLLKDGRTLNTKIAERLTISKQAVGKIRKKLENQGVINSYSVKLDFSCKIFIVGSGKYVDSFNSIGNDLYNATKIRTESVPTSFPSFNNFEYISSNSLHLKLFKLSLSIPNAFPKSSIGTPKELYISKNEYEPLISAGLYSPLDSPELYLAGILVFSVFHKSKADVMRTNNSVENSS